MTCSPVTIWREGSNVVVEADIDGVAVKRYYELHAWERDAQRWGDNFWDQAQETFEDTVSGEMP